MGILVYLSFYGVQTTTEQPLYWKFSNQQLQNGDCLHAIREVKTWMWVGICCHTQNKVLEEDL